MKHYSNEELDIKIHSFLNKKLQKYPELATPHLDAPVFTKPNLKTRMVQSLTSRAILSSN